MNAPTDAMLFAPLDAIERAAEAADIAHTIRDDARWQAIEETCRTPHAFWWALNQAGADDVQGLTPVTEERAAAVAAEPFRDDVTILELVAALLSCEPAQLPGVRIALHAAVRVASAHEIDIRASEIEREMREEAGL